MGTPSDAPAKTRSVPSVLAALPFTTDAPKTSGGV